uniref:Uncharacterized protein n=1 Tax=Fagus sylvatica TaxID=28930 RepID=A0A2N9HQ18_FAGSY
MEGENAFVLVNNPPPNPSGTRRVMSEVRVEANRERVEGQRGRSHATRDVIDAEALRRSRKIERLERELRELKEVQASCDQQRSRRQRSRSHSDSCESSHRCPKRSEEDHRAPKNSRRSKMGRTEEKIPCVQWHFTTGMIFLCAVSFPPVWVMWHSGGLTGSSTGLYTPGRNSAEAFTTRFITNTRKPKEVDSLMALAMRSGESLKSYSARTSMSVLRKTDLQPQKQSGDNVVVQKKSAQPETSRAQRNPKQMGPVTRESFQAINTTFKEPIFKILPQIKNKPYFVWPARLGGDPASRESMSYCAYHREKGHLTETCRNYKALLEELVRDGHLHQFVDSAKHQQQRRPGAAAHLKEIFQVSEGVTPAPKRLRKEMTEEIIFTDRDLEGVQLPHSDALVGLGLEHKDLDRKVDPLYGFSGESVMPVGRVTVKVHAGTISSPTEFLGASLSHELRDGLTALLMEYSDVFAWNPYEAPGVDPAFACHSLNVDPLIHPVVQKGRRISPLHQEAVMPFGLKNAGATYQRMITKMFSSQLGKTVEVYIDDMVVKSIYAEDHLGDLRACIQHVEKAPPQVKHIQMCFWCWVREILGIYGYPTRRGRTFIGENNLTKAFERLKEYLAAAPLLSTPVNGESLYIYLAVSEHAVSAAIVREDYDVQKPVYYTSKTLDGAESRYLPLEKLAFALVCSAKKLPHYFQAHTMIVLTEQPLKAVLRSADFSGRISKWGAQLGAYDINYRPRTSIKGQVLADFIAEFTPAEMGPMWVNHVSSIQHIEGWKLYIDGASNSRGSGLGVVLTAPQGQMMELAIRLGFPASNNVAEYEALLHGLRCAITLQADPLTVYCDSQLVVNQISGDYAAKDEKMKIYLIEAKKLLEKFKHVQVEHIGRDLNGHTDALAGLASAVAPELRRMISVGVQSLPSVDGNAINEDDILPADRKEADRIRRIALRIYYGRSMKAYVEDTPVDGSLAHRAIGQGYWWPYMQKDAAQYFGPLPRAPGNRQWLIVATDYFTKWVEAEPLVHITDADSKRFVWKNIITRFGIPRVLVSDNGSQFTSGPFREFCEQYDIRNHFSTPAYPQTNGQAESSNKTLLDGIKKRLEKAKGRWVEELPNILWTYRTTPRCSTGETPFSLTYGVEAVIPLEIGLPTICTEYYDPVTNETSLATDLDFAEERRDSALIHLAAYQNGLRRIYEKRINPRELAVGDLVLRKVMGAKQDPTHGKLGPNWEGPYKIASVAGTGAFMLIGPNDTPVKRPWNICNLKKYYQ